jgi:hypothetical protein
MKRIKALCIMALVALLCGVGHPPVVVAQQPGFTETFQDPQLPGWEHSPEVIVGGGVLRIAPGNFAARLGVWQDVDVTVELRYSGPGETHVNYRASDTGSYTLILAEETAALVRNEAPGEGQMLAEGRAPQVAAEEWLTLRIILAGGQHTITAGGSPLLQAQDPDPLPPGGLVIASHGERTTEVGRVALQPAGAEPPPGEPAARVEATPGATSTPGAASSQPLTWDSVLRALGDQGTPLELDTFAVNLVLAVVTSFVLSRVYVHWGNSLSNRRVFAANFMLITVTTTFIILVVRSSVALSLGLVGALSIIRFRAAIKEPEELAYLFFAISLGIGLGDNQRLVTLLSLLVVIVLIGLARLLRHRQADVNLHLTLSGRQPDKVGLPAVTAVLDKHTSKLRLLRYDENPETVEMSFVVEFERAADLNQARAALQDLAPSLEISFLDNRGVW